MSSKFFTWTKGDRSRHASDSLFTGAVVPIPVECIHIKGFDYSRAQKVCMLHITHDLYRIILTVRCLQSSRRRPVPLKLDQSPEDLSSYDQQSDDSTALQDAAVKSATSLIAVVNDMLRSPPATARFPPQPSSLAPHHGRPRSRTAPSTPLVEAPARPAPVELPGSIPDRPRASYHHSYDGKLKARTSQVPRQEQPCKSARRPSHPWLHLPLNSDTEVSKANHADEAAKRDSHNLSQWASPSNESGRARASMPSVNTASQSRQSYASGPPPSRHGLSSRESDPRLPRSSLNIMREVNHPLVENQVETLEHDEVPLSDIASLHASHEGHMATTVEAHQREVTSLRMYISFLEQRHGLPRTNKALSHPSAQPCSKLQASGTAAECQTMDLPGHQSLARASYLSQQNSHHGFIDSTVDAHCTSYAPYGEIWLECNHLRDSLETCKRQLAHAEETISRMQRLEMSLKNENGNLRCRLLAANNERMDVQEGLYEACKDLRSLAEREAGLVRENEELRRRSIHAARPTILPDVTMKTTMQRRSGHSRARSDVSCQHVGSGPPPVQNALRSTTPPESSQRHQTETRLSEKKQQAQVDNTRRQYNAHESQMSDFTLSSARAVSLTNVAASALTASTKSVTTATPRTSEGHRNSQPQEKGGMQNDDPHPSKHKLQDAAFDDTGSRPSPSQHTTHPTTPKTKLTRTSYTPTTRTPSPSPSLTSSNSSSTSSSTLAASLPQTPRTVSSTATEVPPMPTTNPYPFAHPRTPPAGVNKRLPKTPLPLDSDPLLLPPPDFSPVIRRGETMKSVGESIIELYGREDGEGWEGEGGGDGKGWVEWV